jgi:hypothetical protein
MDLGTMVLIVSGCFLLLGLIEVAISFKMKKKRVKRKRK